MFCNTKPFTIVRERSCAGPTLVRYDLKEGAVAAGFDVGEKQDCERNAAMATPRPLSDPLTLPPNTTRNANGSSESIWELSKVSS